MKIKSDYLDLQEKYIIPNITKYIEFHIFVQIAITRLGKQLFLELLPNDQVIILAYH